MTLLADGDRPEQLLAVLVIEALVGYPGAFHRRFPHPVVWAGIFISCMEKAWNRGSTAVRRWAGIGAALLLIGVSTTAGMALEMMFTGGIGLVALIILATTGFAQRSLYLHVRDVLIPLERNDIAHARQAVSMIVGRDTDSLDERAVASAATESLAESFCDGIVAPAFWFLIAGLPGLFTFKVISTADSQIGHLNERYRYFGWMAARCDDLMNYIPARIAGLLICIAGMGGWQIMIRDARKHLSPNAGWTEGAMAGVLNVQLGGGAAYGGQWIERATLGDGDPPSSTELKTALNIYICSCLLLWLSVGLLIIGGLIWAR